MNNKLNNNFSLRKLLLTALVAGPLATLPAPLWALPDVTSANLTTSSGVTTQIVGSTLNVTSPDKAILTWQAFGSGASGIAAAEVINYFLPSATSSVLNTVSGPVATTIDGSIISNGNVYVLNKSGIILSQTAQINTGGFYASTVDEPSGFFSINGSLSFAGTSTSGVQVQGSGTTSGTNAATIQAVGPGNNIYLAGNTVSVDGGKFFGNLFVRASGAGNNATLGATGPVSVNLVGTPLVGGGLDVRTNGGNAVLSGGAGNTLTIAPAVASTTGAVSINTTGTATNGTITQGAGAVIANTTGSVVTLNAGTGTGAAAITLGAVDFITVGSTGSNIALTDTAGGITLNGSTATGTLNVTSAAGITQGAGAHSVVGTVTLAQAAANAVSFTGTGNITLAAFANSPATTTLLTSGDLTLGNISASNALSITSSGGQISAGNLSTSSTLTISAPSALGNITSSGIIQSGGVSSISTLGNISVTTRLQVGGGTSNITASGGIITVGALSTSSTVNLSAPAGSITVTNAVTNSGNPLSLSAPTGTVTIGSVAGTNSLTVSAGTISTGAISTSSNTTLTASTGTITTGAISTSSTLTLSAPSTAGAITAGALTSTTTRTVTLSSGGSIALNTTTAPVLSVTSTAGSITQTGIVTSTSSATFAAPLGDITLTNVGNDFSTVVLTGGAGSTGIQVTDKNDIVLGTGTSTLGATTVVAGAGIAAYTGGVPTVTIANNVITATATVTRNTTSQTITSLAVGGAGLGGAGYLVAPTVSFAGGGGTGAAATAILSTSGTGVVTGFTVTNSGSGYTSNPTVTLTGPTGTASTAVATLNLAGVVDSVTVTPGTAPFASAPVITFAPAGGGAGSGAIATASLTSNLLTPTSIVPLQSGSITLGNNAIDTLTFGGTLSLSTTGIAGTNGVTNYSQITTAANNVRVFGNVTLNTNNTNASLGNNTFGNAANYSFGQINANVGTGTLSLIESQTVNLGAITAATLDARSLAGNIVNTGKLTVGGNAIFAANSIFSPGDVTLTNSTNAMSGAILIGNAKDFTLVNTGVTNVTAGTALVNGKAATGNVNVTVLGAGNTLTLKTDVAGVQTGGDFATVSFSAPGNVVITDPNTVTLQNIANTGTGTVNVTTGGVGLSGGPIVLGSGIVLGSTGLTTLTSNGATAAITDSAPGIRITGNVALVSDNSIAITNASHSFGPVSLTTTGANGVNGTANITYTEGGSANLNFVNVNTSASATVPAGSLTVVSTGGDVIQTVGGSILVPATGTGTNTVSFSSSKGAVSLPNTANSIAPVIAVSAVGNSTLAQAANIALGNVAVSGGTLTVDGSTGVATTIAQSTGSTIKAFGNATFKTQAGKITLSNSGNNFGGLTLTSNVGAAAGADVAITEAGTLNLVSVNTGTAGKLTATSEKAAIIQSGTLPIAVGGTTSLTAADAGVNLTSSTTNNFGGSTVLVTTVGNVSIADSNATTILNGASTVGGSLSLRNTAGAGTIKDSPGTLTVSGNVLFDTSTAGNITGTVSIGSSTASLGGIQFRSGAVTIVENATLTLLAGSVASGAVSLTSSGNIVTSGSGGGTFQNKLDLNASGSITVTNPIFVNGAAGAGLTFRALGAVDLSALSLAGNLNSIAPTNLGASSYKAPTP